jgi:hypothetical protein
MDAGGGNVSGGDASGCCYYALLGIRKNASATDIRAAYRRLALVSSPVALLCSVPFRSCAREGSRLIVRALRRADFPISCLVGA